MKPGSRYRFLLTLWLAAGLPLLVAISLVAFYEYRYADRVYPGVQVAGIPVGGLTIQDATTTLANRLRPTDREPVTLTYGEKRWTLTAVDLGLAVEPRALAGAAFAVGRADPGGRSTWRRLGGNLWAQTEALLFGRVITATVGIDDTRLDYALKRIAHELDSPPIEATLAISGTAVTALPGHAGHIVDSGTTRAALVARLLSGGGGAVPVMVEVRQPVIRNTDRAATEAAGLLAEPLVLSVFLPDGVPESGTQAQHFTVEPTELAQWLSFGLLSNPDGTAGLDVQVNQVGPAALLKQIAKQIDLPAKDATLDFDPDAKQVSVVTPSRVGRELDVPGAIAAITTTIHGLARAAGGDAPGPAPSREITLTVNLVRPLLDSNRLPDLGIVELVSQGTTYFAGSSEERVQNIVAAANKFRGVVIPPDREFSFNHHLGEITPENGFVEGLIIWGDRTAVGVGGGVCQVSTTVFRAAFFGGFPIVERWAHGYVVSWYGEPGLDATIYTPDVDFRFRNDTGHFLLVNSEVDTVKGRLTFYFYGTRPARTVEADEPVVTNLTPPDEPIYQEDRTLAPGVIRQVEWPKNGQDVVITRYIRSADGTVQEEKFESKYQPWRAMFLAGPGTELPPGAVVIPAPTATPAPKP